MAETLGTAELILTADTTRLQAGLNQAQQQAQRTGDAIEGAFQKPGSRINAAAGQISNVGEEAKNAGVGVGSLGGQLANLAAQLGLTTSATGVLLYSFQQIKAADDAGAAVRTLGVDSVELKSRLSDLSNELDASISTVDLLKASYDVASSGFADAASATDILRASAAGARGGFADINEVAKATTAVLNAYGMSSAEAGRVVDGFVQAQADGVLTVRQYADNIGEIVSVASAAGISIEELNAAIATATLKGVQVNQAFTGFRQVISSILKPSKEATDLAKSLGIDYSLAGLQAKGFAGFLQDVAAKTGAAADKTAILLGSVEAQAALQPLLNDQLAKYNELLDNQAQKAGTAAKAADTASNTISGSLTKIQNRLSNIATTINTDTNPALSGTFDLVNKLVGAFERLATASSKVPKGKGAASQAGQLLGNLPNILGGPAVPGGPLGGFVLGLLQVPFIRESIGTPAKEAIEALKELIPLQKEAKEEATQPAAPTPLRLGGTKEESDAFWSRLAQDRTQAAEEAAKAAKEGIKLQEAFKKAGEQAAENLRNAAKGFADARLSFAGAVGQQFAIATNEQRLRARQINEERIRAAERAGAFDPARVAMRYGLEQTSAGLNLQNLTFRQLERLAGEVGSLANAETNLQTAMTANTTALQELAKRKWEVQVNVRNNANGTTAVDYVNNLR